MTKKSKQKIIGELLADILSEFGGSWKFLLLFGMMIIGWMFFNTVMILEDFHFDKYPYILLNLVLSCVAAIQAPIIMMSANRQAEKDRNLQRKDVEIGRVVVDQLQEVTKQIQLLNSNLNNHKDHSNGKNLVNIKNNDLED